MPPLAKAITLMTTNLYWPPAQWADYNPAPENLQNWLRANDLDPAQIAMDSTIFTEDGVIVVSKHQVLDGDGKPIKSGDGSRLIWESVQVPLVVPAVEFAVEVIR